MWFIDNGITERTANAQYLKQPAVEGLSNSKYTIRAAHKDRFHIEQDSRQSWTRG